MPEPWTSTPSDSIKPPDWAFCPALGPKRRSGSAPLSMAGGDHTMSNPVWIEGAGPDCGGDAGHGIQPVLPTQIGDAGGQDGFLDAHAGGEIDDTAAGHAAVELLCRLPGGVLGTCGATGGRDHGVGATQPVEDALEHIGGALIAVLQLGDGALDRLDAGALEGPQHGGAGIVEPP